MNNNPKISIIVPVYNTEAYIRQCIESLFNQTLKEIEIICVNDGSKDKSGEILKELAIKDSRLKIIEQENKGQSAARNKGMESAIGEFVGFLDSDDWAEPKMFEELYKKAIKKNADISMCSITVHDEKTSLSTTNDPYMTLNIFPKHLHEKGFSYQDCQDFFFRICVVPWNKIYNRRWLRSKEIKFIEDLNFEDVVFAVEAMLQARLTIVNEPLVNYRRFSQTSYSQGNCALDYKKMDFFKIYDEIQNILVKLDKFEFFKEYFAFYKKNNLIYWYEKILDPKTKKIFKNKLLKLYPDFRFRFLTQKIKKNKLRKKIEQIAKKNSVAIWGAGQLVQSVLKPGHKNILGFIDSNPELTNQTRLGYKIYPIEDLTVINPDFILAITQNYYKFDKLIQNQLEDSGLNFKIIKLDF